jgi:hypothetical protein
MGIITTGNHPKALWPGVFDFWGLKYTEHPLECFDLFDKKPSSKSYEELVQTTSFGLAPVKSQGGAVVYDSHQQGYLTRAVNIVYGLGYIVTREEREDNLYEDVSMRRAESLAFSIRQTQETVSANVYNRAFNSAFTYGDGVEMCSAVHPNSTGGTWSNELAVPAALAETSIEDMLIQVMGATNDRGLKISLMGESLHVPRQLWFEANRILKSILQNDTANHALNVLKATNSLPKGIKVNHYFDDANNWFIRTNVPSSGMCYFDRRSADFTRDNDFNTDNAKAKSTIRFAVTVGDPRAVYGSAPA